MKQKENNLDSVDLLTSILIRYPEVGTIKIDPGRNVLNLVFIVSGITSSNISENLKKQLVSCLKTFHFLKNIQSKILDVKYNFYEDLTLLEISRDIDTLNSTEIALTINFLKEFFKDHLISEHSGFFKEEDLSIQDEVIGKILENVRFVPKNKIIAFREKGRVMVFNS